MDKLVQFIESANIVSSPFTVAEAEICLSMWSQVYVEPIVGDSDSVGLLDMFVSQKISHFYDEFALAEYRKQILPCYLLTTDGSAGLMCQSKPPADLQKFCEKNGRKPNNSTCEIIVCADDFQWTLAVNIENYFFAYAPLEINQQVLEELHSKALKR